MTATTTRAAIRTRSRRLAPLAVVFLGVGLSTALSLPFLSLFLSTAIHAGPVRLSFFLLAQPLCGILVSTVVGRLSDGRIARRRLMIACAVAGCTSASLFSVLRSYWPLLLLACTVTSIAVSLLPQGFAYAREVLGDDPSAPMVTSTLRTFFSLSWVAGPPLASVLLTAGGFTALYVCSAALYAVVLGVVVLWLREPVVMASRVGKPADLGVADGARRSLWITLAALVLLQSAIWLNVQAIPLLVRHQLHTGVGSAGVVLGVCAALEIPAMLGFGALSARVPLQRLIRIGPLFGIAYYRVVSVADEVWQLGVAQLLDACYIAVIQGLAISYIQLLLPLQPGRASTLFTNTFPCGAIIASPLLGVGARFGYRVSFVAAAAVTLGGLLLLLAARPARPVVAAPAWPQFMRANAHNGCSGCREVRGRLHLARAPAGEPARMASISQIADQVAPNALAAPTLLLVAGGDSAESVRAALHGAPEGFRLVHVEAVDEAASAGELPLCAMLTLRPGDSTALEQVRSLRSSAPRVPILVLIDHDQDESLGVLAMQEGAQDYALLGELSGKVLRRAIRYAVERKRAIDSLAVRDATQRGVLDALRESVAVLNRAGTVVSANRRWTDSVAGYLSRTAASSVGAGIGASYSAILTAWGDDAWTREALIGLRRIMDGEITSYDVPRTIEREGATYAVRLRGLPTGGAFVIHDDVTALVRADQALSHAAMHDSLTGLPNRPLFHDRVERAMARVAAGKSAGFSVLVVDIDRFTVVNDTHGHAAGDVVLAALAARIREAAGVTDTVARFGGDQFVVVSEESPTEASAQMLSLKLREAVALPVGYADTEISVAASIGIAICDGTDTTVPALIRDASSALLEARQAGPSRSRVISAEGREAASTRLDIESGLRRAIARDELVLHYLPEVTSKGRVLHSVEALVRWEHPSRGLLAPRDFLPVAERSGLIVDIGNWVIERACADAAVWRREVSGAANVGVSVNLSSQHVGDLRLLDTVSEALRRHGVPPRLLTLEITEDVMLNDAEEILEALQALRSYGVRLAVDDFGTGFSSLAYLCALPVQALKMDHDFAAQVVDNERSRTMVANIVTMAHQLDLMVTAEGVESEQQAALLDGIGVDLLQGFHFGQPADLHGLMGNLSVLLG